MGEKPKALPNLAYYLRVCVRHDLLEERRPRRAWNHFWASRWFWSGGLLASPPLHYQPTTQSDRKAPNG